MATRMPLKVSAFALSTLLVLFHYHHQQYYHYSSKVDFLRFVASGPFSYPYMPHDQFQGNAYASAGRL
jgi:hypothetical protein